MGWLKHEDDGPPIEIEVGHTEAGAEDAAEDSARCSVRPGDGRGRMRSVVLVACRCGDRRRRNADGQS